MKRLISVVLIILIAFCTSIGIAEESISDDEIRELVIKNARLVNESQRFCDNLTFAKEFWVVERSMGSPLILINYELEDIAGNITENASLFLGDIYIDTLYGLASALDYYSSIKNFNNQDSTVMGDYMMYTLAYNCLGALEKGNYTSIYLDDIAEEIGID